MSLWMTLMANRDALGTLVVRRLDNLDQNVLPDDTVSTYLVIRDGQEQGKVRHRYGDGPWALVREALEL